MSKLIDLHKAVCVEADWPHREPGKAACDYLHALIEGAVAETRQVEREKWASVKAAVKKGVEPSAN